MGVLRNLIDSVLSRDQGTAGAPGQQDLLNSVLGMIGGRGLNGVLDAFRQNGLGEAVQSWIGTGANKPISREEVQSSLGEQQIQDIAHRAGLSQDEAAGGLAQLLPQIVDKLTPDGKLPDAAGLARMLKSPLGGSVHPQA